MTGIMLGLAAGSGGAGGGAGGGGTPNAIAWSTPYGDGVAATNAPVVSGVGGGTASITATLTGGASLQSVVNGVGKPYAGAFLVSDGDTLGWLLVNPGTSKLAGTVTVKCGTFTVGTFPYTVLGSNNL